MPFRVKDILIDVTSQTAAGLADRFHYCGVFNHSCWLVCSNHITNLCTLTCTHHGSPIPTPTIQLTCPGSQITDTLPTTTVVIDPGGLKERLKQTLAAAEAAEKFQAQSEQPQTLADVEMLEKKLAEAAEALRARKAELQKPAK